MKLLNRGVNPYASVQTSPLEKNCIIVPYCPARLVMCTPTAVGIPC